MIYAWLVGFLGLVYLDEYGSALLVLVELFLLFFLLS
jgi:hypothetical protein